MATRKQAQEAELRRISQVGDFKKRLGGVIELPSGFMVKVRNPGGLNAFIDSETMPNSLLTIVKNSLEKGKAVNQEEIFKDGVDLNTLKELQQLMDSVAIKTMVEPPLYHVPTQKDMDKYNEANPDSPISHPEELRQEDRLYVDELPDDDKMYLLGWITGGVKDLETFRKQQEEGVDNMAQVRSAVKDAQRTDRAISG